MGARKERVSRRSDGEYELRSSSLDLELENAVNDCDLQRACVPLGGDYVGQSPCGVNDTGSNAVTFHAPSRTRSDCASGHSEL